MEGTQEAAPPGAVGALTLVHVYNRLLVDMLLELKGCNPALKAALRESHKAIAPSSDAYIKHALSTLPLNRLASSTLAPADALADAQVLAFEPLSGISVALLSAERTDGADAEAAAGAMQGYLYTLAAVAATYAECVADSCTAEAAEALVSSVLKVLGQAQMGADVHAHGVLDGILDDDIAHLLERVAEVSASCPGAAAVTAAAAAAAEDAPSFEDVGGLLKALGGSRIAGLAQEISKEIDLSQLPTDDPSKLLNFADLGDSNSVLGSIVGKVGSKIQTKLASGELRHEELLADAVSMLKAFDGNSMLAGNPLVSEMLKAARSGKLNLGGAAGSARNASARERLRRKLAAGK